MRQVQQRIISADTGDCLKCCVASILDLSYEDVPNFAEKFPDGRMWGALWEWLYPRGYEFHSEYPGNLTTLERPIIACVSSKNFPGVYHAVVWQGDKMIFDPSPHQNAGEDIPKSFVVISRRKEQETENGSK